MREIQFYFLDKYHTTLTVTWDIHYHRLSDINVLDLQSDTIED